MHKLMSIFNFALSVYLLSHGISTKKRGKIFISQSWGSMRIRIQIQTVKLALKSLNSWLISGHNGQIHPHHRNKWPGKSCIGDSQRIYHWTNLMSHDSSRDIRIHAQSSFFRLNRNWIQNWVNPLALKKISDLFAADFWRPATEVRRKS